MEGWSLTYKRCKDLETIMPHFETLFLGLEAIKNRSAPAIK
jgi:hypothetical protein